MGEWTGSKVSNPMRVGSNLSNKTKLSKEDIFNLAYMYFVEDASLTDMAEASGASRSVMGDITSGNGHSDNWVDAVAKLINAGYSVDRKDRELANIVKRKNQPRPKIVAATVKNIRRRYAKGDSVEDIFRSLKIKKATVVSIVRGDTYQGEEYQVVD